mmetsp:Transcript_33212/g.93109  ORF Transcript_33212/g.93109 Transcript_33212/m.93109 type:complete len:231 (-) Transcript_33212:398-1090(-)
MKLVLLLRLPEKLTDVLFGLPHILVQNFRTKNDFRLPSIQHFANLPRHERFPSPRGTVQENTLDMFDAHFFHNRGRKEPGRERPAENFHKLLIHSTDSNILKIEVRPNDAWLRPATSASLDNETRTLGLGKKARRRLHQHTLGRVNDSISRLPLQVVDRQCLHCYDFGDHPCTVDVEKKALSLRKHLSVEERHGLGHTVGVKRLRSHVVLIEEVELNVDGVKEHVLVRVK